MLAKLKFLTALPLYDVEKPYTLYGFSEEVKPRSNCLYEFHDGIQVTDARGSESTFSLDSCGFEFHKKPLSCDFRVESFEDVSGRVSLGKYLQETISMVTDTLRADTVLCFDWRLRKSKNFGDINDQFKDVENARYVAIPPATLMHCDYSYGSGLQILQAHLFPQELKEFADGHFRIKIVNVWRPLNVVRYAPLVLCDCRSVNSNDLVEADQVGITNVEETLILKHRDGQQFYWLSEQSPDEVVLFTSWDSIQEKAFANHTPHGAYLSEPTEMGASRESVEVRLIIMWKNDQT